MELLDRQLSWLDHTRLFKLVRTHTGPCLSAQTSQQAKDVLDLAELVDPHVIPNTVVTMRSRVRLELRHGRMLEVTLAYPDEIGMAEGSVSVFSPLGLSLLGARLGARIDWTGPNGEAHYATVREVLYQPEAAGDFAL